MQPDKNGNLPPLAAERTRLGLPAVNRGPGENHVPFCDALARRGYVCMRVEYRTRGKDGVLPGDDIADAMCAMRWVRGHAALLGVDPDRVVAAGGSSGGYLAASLFAFEDRFPAGADTPLPVRPNAIILYSPLVDWLEVGNMSASFLVVLNGDKELGAKISPARHWRRDCPPTLVMVGTEEPPFTTVKAFAEKWRGEHAAMELFVADGGKHGFFAQPAWVERTLALTDEFLRVHRLQAEPSPPKAAKPSATPPPASQTYKAIGERKLQLAVHYPSDWNPADKRPAIVFFSGGGFNPKDKATGQPNPTAVERAQEGRLPANTGPGQGFAEEAENFALRGLVGIRVEYRKRKTDGVLPDKAVEDAKSAMRWVRANAAQLGLIRTGSYRAAVPPAVIWQRASRRWRISMRPATTCESPRAERDDAPLPPPGFPRRRHRTTPFLDALDGDRELGERLSPARHWRTDLPPTLVLIGTKDPMFESVNRFVARWKDAGGDLALYIGEGGNHGFSTTGPWRECSTGAWRSFSARWAASTRSRRCRQPLHRETPRP